MHRDRGGFDPRDAVDLKSEGLPLGWGLGMRRGV